MGFYNEGNLMLNNRAVSLGMTCAFIAPLANADFVSDSHLKLDMRNFYLSRDFVNSGNTREDITSWSQGFDLQFSSGYTQGMVGFGLDASVQSAFNLGSSGGNEGSLPYSTSRGKEVSEYSRGSGALKARFSKTEVRIGEQRPTLPIAFFDDSRQLPTLYEGLVVKSNEIDNLTLNFGRFWGTRTRESTNSEKIYLFGTNDHLNSEGMNFAGGTYRFTPALSVTGYYSELEDIYTQKYLAMSYELPLPREFSLKTDLRYYDSQESGNALDGAVDNQLYGSLFTLKKGGHAFSVGLQHIGGTTLFPVLNGYIPVPYAIYWPTPDFLRPNDINWGVGYTYDFAAAGIPGLTFYSRFTKSQGIDVNGTEEKNHVSERKFMVSYTLQGGPLKGLGLLWFNARTLVRTGNDTDETRLLATYTWNFF